MMMQQRRMAKVAVTQKYKQNVYRLQDLGPRQSYNTLKKIRISLAVVSLYNDFRRAA
jgi:hypothetical protein